MHTFRLFLAVVSILLIPLASGRADVADSPVLPPGLHLRSQPFGASDDVIRPATTDQAKFIRDWAAYLASEAARGGALEKIGWFKLDDFRRELAEVDIWVNNSNRAVLGSGGRIGSVYLTERKLIIVNLSLLGSITPTSAFQPLGTGNECLFLHEFLGALGYPDENYEISSYLWARTFPADFSTEVFGGIETALSRHLAVNGRRARSPGAGLTLASTGVGGGGDPASAAVKIYAYLVMAQHRDQVAPLAGSGSGDYRRLIREVTLARIEPIEDAFAYRPDRSLVAGPVLETRFGAQGPYVAVNATRILEATETRSITVIGEDFIRRVLSFREGATGTGTR